MLATETSQSIRSTGADPSYVAQEFRERVLPCGVGEVNRLEASVEAKLTAVRELERIPADRFPAAFQSVLGGVVSTRPWRVDLVARTDPAAVRTILRDAHGGRLGPSDLPAVARRFDGAPADVGIDLASELLHAAAPDRIALLARWVWNPARRTGILAAFGGSDPESYAATQARLGEIRLQLGALGFPSQTFAGVDVLLALSYAGRLGEATDRSFQGGGIERLLPGPFPLATMLLGVRRRPTFADR